MIRKSSNAGKLNKTDNKVKNSKKSKLSDKLSMYDMILANIATGKSVINPNVKLNNSMLHIGFNSIESEDQMSKYFMVTNLPDYIDDNLVGTIRRVCGNPNVKINFFFYTEPYKINWDSSEMRNRMSILENFSNEHSSEVGVFEYRNKRADALKKVRIVTTVSYLNKAENEQRRSILRTSIVIQLSSKRTDQGIVDLTDSISSLNTYCRNAGLTIKELRINMIDWLRALSPFSLAGSKETKGHVVKRLMTDDNLANLNTYKQGTVGLEGVPLGMDILSFQTVLYYFKKDPDAAENWLITGETGSGKSMFVKSMLPYFLAIGYTLVIMDYEGDEYTNLADFTAQGDKDSVKIVSMGKSSKVYFDPCAISDLTGDDDMDSTLKESAISFTKAIFRIIVKGSDSDFTIEEDKVLSLAIQRMYDSVGVTEDNRTWVRSKKLTLHDVYHEISEMHIRKEFVAEVDDGAKQRAVSTIMDACSPYFEEGGINYHMFENPMSADELYKAQLIVFSFGMKGASDSTVDPKMLALKQLSVAYINIQISNYCKYVKHTFNVKVWEEFQRWGNTKGSADTISNAITGGRKRGDINFILTNNLTAMLDDNNRLTANLKGNFQGYIVGKLNTEPTIEKFCDIFSKQEVKTALETISRSKSGNTKVGSETSLSENKYSHAFCVMFSDGTDVIVRSFLPKSILGSKLFKTGVVIK